MLRTILVVVFISALISAALFGNQWLKSPNNRPVAGSQPDCDLLVAPCEWETQSGHWRVELQVMGDNGQGTEYQLTVKSPAEQNRFLAVLRGESMYMGEYPVPMRQSGVGQYSAVFTAPLCTTDAQMIWRIDLQEGQRAVAEPAPFKLVFQAKDH